MEIVYYVAASVDGYIATPDGGVGWLDPFSDPDEDYGYGSFFSSVDAIPLGSRTYEQALSFGAWPYVDRPCRVFSRRSLPAGQPGVVVTSRPPREVVLELEAEGHRRSWLVGGTGLATSFREAGLISEYIVSVIPVLLGDGVPLFRRSAIRESLQLRSSRDYPSGIAQLHYRVLP